MRSYRIRYGTVRHKRTSIIMVPHGEDLLQHIYEKIGAICVSWEIIEP